MNEKQFLETKERSNELLKMETRYDAMEPLKYQYKGFYSHTRFRGEDTDEYVILYIENPDQITNERLDELRKYFRRNYRTYCPYGFTDILITDNESIEGDYSIR